MFLGLDANAWAAVGSTAQAAITLLLLGVGAWQVRVLKRENLKTRTLAVCDKYDTDPVLDASLRDLHKRPVTDGSHDLGDLKVQAATVLNYLDSISVGIEQGLYIEKLVRDHLKAIVTKHVNDYLRDDSAALRVGVDRSHYRALIRMAERWENDPPAFHDNWFKWRSA